MILPRRAKAGQHSLLKRHTGYEEAREIDSMLKRRVVLVQ